MPAAVTVEMATAIMGSKPEVVPKRVERRSKLAVEERRVRPAVVVRVVVRREAKRE